MKRRVIVGNICNVVKTIRQSSVYATLHCYSERCYLTIFHFIIEYMHFQSIRFQEITESTSANLVEGIFLSIL